MRKITNSLLAVNCLLVLTNVGLRAQSFSEYKQEVTQTEYEIEMVPVKGGEFQMGNNSSSASSDQKPVHAVKVGDFWMGKYEISWELYEEFIFRAVKEDDFITSQQMKALGIDGVTGATPPYVDMSFGMGKGKHPAVNMTQYAALVFCKWLTAKTGVFYRLPTEAEWEYACKIGNTDEGRKIKDRAWIADNSDDKYALVGLKIPNELGIYDMLGNVTEWTMDAYKADYYAKSKKNNPWNAPKELYPKTVRGGAWKLDADQATCTVRIPSVPKWKRRDPQIPKSRWWLTNAPFVGFRIVRPVEAPSAAEISKYWLEPIDDY